MLQTPQVAGDRMEAGGRISSDVEAFEKPQGSLDNITDTDVAEVTSLASTAIRSVMRPDVADA